MQILRWLWNNKGSLLLAFVLALTVWVAAVSADDPTIERPMDVPIPITYLSPSDEFQIVGELPQSAQLTLRAPQSVWDKISSDNLIIEIDLSHYDAGTHKITIKKPVFDLRPLQVVSIEPAEISFTLEPILTKEIAITINVLGDPAIEFDAKEASFTPETAVIRGPQSAVNLVTELRSEIEITSARQEVEGDPLLLAFDENGQVVEGVEIEPASVHVIIPIEQSDRYRLVSVIPKIIGSPAYGYRIKSVLTFPELVQVTSSDPDAIAVLPGFVDTEPIDISGATETIERRVFLDLPFGFTIVGNQTILVKTTIEAIESSLTFNLPIEVQGLTPDLVAEFTPETVIITLTGPLTILQDMQPEDVRVFINLVDLEEGSYVVPPEVVVPQVEVQAETIPATIEVEISIAPPVTATPTP
jgi:YbbR domain-containing protein